MSLIFKLINFILFYRSFSGGARSRSRSPYSPRGGGAGGAGGGRRRGSPVYNDFRPRVSRSRSRSFNNY